MKEEIQEREFEFPYHHIPTWDGKRFSQSRTLWWGYEYLGYLEFLIDLLKSRPFSSLLDVGCGDGRFLKEVARHFPRSRLVGVDTSEKAIRFAKAFQPEIDFRVEDITAKRGEERFDVVTAIEVLEHIPARNLPRFIQAIRARFADSGVLLFTVPSRNLPVATKHVQHFDVPMLRKMLEPTFHITNVYFLNKISWQEALVRRLLSNRLFILSSQTLAGRLFAYYRKNLLMAEEKTCKRICLVASPARA